jgi:quercetin 2,3-dioxygenase
MSMKQRKIKQTVRPQTTSDGAGVLIKRSIGTFSLNYLDPFLLFDHFGSENADDYIAGFPVHPHRGIETVTYLLSGVIKHRDSAGNEGILLPGDVQWMTAGSGIMHEEMPQIRAGKMEGFQLWVNLPSEKKMTPPRYQEYKAESIPAARFESGIIVKVIAGQINEIEGIVKGTDADPTYLDVFIPAGVDFKQQISAGHTAFAYVYEGAADFAAPNQKIVDAPQLIIFEDGDFIEVKTSDSGVRFLLICGKALNEPLARYGPFVMNTNEEIETALRELQNGTFVKQQIARSE